MAVTGRYGNPGGSGGALSARRLLAFAPGALSARLFSGPAPRIVEILLVLVLAVCLARIAIAIAAPLPLPQGQAVASAPVEGSGNMPVTAKSPFPSTVIADEPVETAPSVAETTLDLTLTGIWADMENGSATIRTPDGKQSRYAVGDMIVPGVILDAVFADQAIISRDGVRESLRFESKAMIEDAPQPIRPHGRRDPNAPPTSVTSVALGELSSILRLAPSLNREGQLVIEVYASRNRAAFAALGLQDGDRIMSIDGAATPTDPAALTAAMNRMQRQGSANLVIERNGDTVPLAISLTDLGIE